MTTWEPSIHRHTRSSSRKTTEADAWLPFWVLERALVEDMMVYQEAGRSIRQNIAAYRKMMTTAQYQQQTIQHLMTMIPETSRLRYVQTDVVEIFPGANTGLYVFYFQTQTADAEQEDSIVTVVPVPWSLMLCDGKIRPHTPIQEQMMRDVEIFLGGSNNVYFFSTFSNYPRSDIKIGRLRDSKEVVSDIFDKKKTYASLLSILSIVRLLLLEDEKMCWEDVKMRPDMKYKTNNRLYSFDVETQGRLQKMRGALAKKYHELTLLPYITTPARLRCRKNGFYDYTSEGFQTYLRNHESDFHPGLKGFTLPWLSTLQVMTPTTPWVVDRNRLQEALSSVLHDHWLFIDFETNNVPRRNNNDNDDNDDGLEQRIYMCGCYHVDWSTTSGGTPTTNMRLLVSRDLNDPLAELDLVQEIAAEIQKATHVFYYSAERGFWKTACIRRLGFSPSHPTTRLLDSAIDLLEIIRFSKLFLRDAPNQKLKTIGDALLRCHAVSLAFPPSDISGGEDSMFVSKLFYQELHPLSHPEDNTVFVLDSPSYLTTALDANVIKTPDPWRIKKFFIDHHHHPEPSDTLVKTCTSLVVYNQYDCIILAQILTFLLNILKVPETSSSP